MLSNGALFVSKRSVRSLPLRRDWRNDQRMADQAEPSVHYRLSGTAEPDEARRVRQRARLILDLLSPQSPIPP
jgi:hypothetical protein